MGLGPLELSGVLQRTQDIATIRHNEEHKGQVDQNHFVDRLNKEYKTLGDAFANEEFEQKKFDAKEKGSNEYTGDGGRHKKDEDAHSHGHDKEGVRIKMSESSFDIRI